MPSRSLPFVLLVEDSDDDAFFFERALKKTKLPYELLRMRDGGAAIRFLESCLSPPPLKNQRYPALLVLDLKLPVCSGFEILQWLVERGALPHFKIAILSGSQSAVDIVQATSLGVLDYLVKPVSADVLLARLQPGRPASTAPVLASPTSE